MARGVGQRSGQTVELGDHEVSPARQAAGAWRSPGRSRLVPVKTLADVGPLGADAERGEGISLGG